MLDIWEGILTAKIKIWEWNMSSFKVSEMEPDSILMVLRKRNFKGYNKDCTWMKINYLSCNPKNLIKCVSCPRITGGATDCFKNANVISGTSSLITVVDRLSPCCKQSRFQSSCKKSLTWNSRETAKSSTKLLGMDLLSWNYHSDMAVNPVDKKDRSYMHLNYS